MYDTFSCIVPGKPKGETPKRGNFRFYIGDSIKSGATPCRETVTDLLRVADVQPSRATVGDLLAVGQCYTGGQVQP